MADRLVQMTTTFLIGSEQCKLQVGSSLLSFTSSNSCSKRDGPPSFADRDSWIMDYGSSLLKPIALQSMKRFGTTEL